MVKGKAGIWCAALLVLALAAPLPALADDGAAVDIWQAVRSWVAAVFDGGDPASGDPPPGDDDDESSPHMPVGG